MVEFLENKFYYIIKKLNTSNYFLISNKIH